MKNTTDTHSWNTYVRRILGKDHVPISLSSLPEPTEFDHTMINNTIRKHNQKCNTLLHNSLSENKVDIKHINKLPHMTLASDNSYQYNHDKFCHYIKYLDMVANLTPSDKANPVLTYKKLINYYVKNVVGS